MSDSTDTNKALMLRIYEEMWNGKDPALAAEIFERPEGVERFVGEFLLSFPDLRHTVIEMIAEGNTVVAKFSAVGTHAGTWMHFAATGKPVQYTGVTWARIQHGKIIEHYTWWEKASLIEQIQS